MAGAAGTGDDFLDGVLNDVEQDHRSSAAPSAPSAGRASGAAAQEAAAIEAAAASKGRGRAGAASGKGGAGGDEDDPGSEALSKAMEEMMKQVAQPEFQEHLQKQLDDMGDPGQGADGPSLFSGVDGSEDMDANVASTMQLLQKLASTGDGEGEEAKKISEEVMKNMAEDFEKLGQKEDFQEVVDNMMKQLLSKDIMYEPIKQICERFPEWLAKHAEGLSQKEYDNYGNQYRIFQKLVAVYDTEPDNFARLTEHMQDLQATGSPPKEIIKELAPGLEVGEDGMPMLPNMGPGIPGVPAMPGGCTIS